jgi:hypothetical protein
LVREDTRYMCHMVFLLFVSLVIFWIWIDALGGCICSFGSDGVADWVCGFWCIACGWGFGDGMEEGGVIVIWGGEGENIYLLIIAVREMCSW